MAVLIFVSKEYSRHEQAENIVLSHPWNMIHYYGISRELAATDYTMYIVIQTDKVSRHSESLFQQLFSSNYNIQKNHCDQ